MYILIDPLDLVDDGVLPFFQKDSVCPSFDHKRVFLILVFDFQRNLRMIRGSHPALELPMDPAALLHGLLRGRPPPAIVNISGAQNKLHQIPHGNPDLFHSLLLPNRSFKLLRISV